MLKRSIIIALSTLFFIQPSFATMSGDGSSSDKHCEVIATACTNAGYEGNDTSDKSFWFGCMRPLLLGKAVNGVTIDRKDIKECRKAKIARMMKEIQELRAAK